jgi:MFS family permease
MLRRRSKEAGWPMPDPWTPRPARVVPRMMLASALTSGAVEGAAVAVAVVVYAATGSTAWVSASLVVSLGLAAVLGPLGGVVADRYPRRTVMLTVALIEALVFVVVAAAHDPWQLVALSALAAVVFLPFEGSITAILPTLVDDQELPKAVGSISAAQQTATLVAPAAAGALLGVLGKEATFVIVAALYAASAAAIVGLPRVPAAVRAAAGLGGELRDGLRSITGDRVILTITVAHTLLVVFSAATLVAGVALSEEEFDAGDTGYGLMVSAWGAGMVAGSLLAGRLVYRRAPILLFSGGLVLSGLSLATVAAAPGLATALAALAIGGVGNGAEFTAKTVLYQRRIANEVLGRARSAELAVARAAYACSFLLGGLLVPVVGVRGVFAFAALGTLVAAIPAIGLIVSRTARAPAEPPAPSG